MPPRPKEAPGCRVERELCRLPLLYRFLSHGRAARDRGAPQRRDHAPRHLTLVRPGGDLNSPVGEGWKGLGLKLKSISEFVGCGLFIKVENRHFATLYGTVTFPCQATMSLVAKS